MRTLIRSGLAVVPLLTLVACTSKPDSTLGIRATASSVHLGAGPAWGHFLEDTEVAADRKGGQRRSRSLPVSLAGFGYHNIRLQSPDGTDLNTTLFGTKATSGKSTVACGRGGFVLQQWIYSGSGTGGLFADKPQIQWSIAGPSAETVVPLDVGSIEPRQLVMFEVDSARLQTNPCHNSRLRVEWRGLPEGWAASPPAVIQDGGEHPPIILISVDTLRRDKWDHERDDRPEALDALLRDSHRFTRAYSPYPSTPPSHSVMLSGHTLQHLRDTPVDDSMSWVAALRSKGYTTQAYVSGGFIRSQFGWFSRDPGFALGFDHYIEGIHFTGKDLYELAKQAKTRLASERLLVKHTHSLAPSLERSLRWFERHGDQQTFHFLHGFDVHEYRGVYREYWEFAAGLHLDAAADRGAAKAELDGCVAEVGLQMDDEYVAHHRFYAGERYRHRRQNQPRPCQKLLATLMYEARVRSAEVAMGRYIEGLKKLGIYDQAMIIFTSDHGEGLLDEVHYWGHNRLLHNNLSIPMWIKLPKGHEHNPPRQHDTVVGLVDLRATVAAILNVNLGESYGRDMFSPATARKGPVEFASGRGTGFVLASGDLCRWSNQNLLEVYDSAAQGWRVARPFQETPCRDARAGLVQGPAPVGLPEVPGHLKEELRALGYLE